MGLHSRLSDTSLSANAWNNKRFCFCDSEQRRQLGRQLHSVEYLDSKTIKVKRRFTGVEKQLEGNNLFI